MRRTILAAAAVTGAVIGLPGTASAAQTTYVTPDDIAASCAAPLTLDFCEYERDSGTAEIGAGTPDAASGTEHLLIDTPLGNDKAYVFGYEFAGRSLGSLETLGYRSLVTGVSDANADQAPALNIEIDRNGGDLRPGDYAVLVWEPLYTEESTEAGVWLQRSPSSSDGGWWSPANGFTTGAVGPLGFRTYTAGWDEVQDALPLATVLGIGINQGGGNQGLASEVDLLQVNSTVYDFGLAPGAKDECKKGGWAQFEAPAFRNQGDCVSYVARQGRNG